MKYLMISITSFLIGVLLSGCFGPSASNGGDVGTDSDSEDTDTDSDSDTEMCPDGRCLECSSGPCCDEDGSFKGPSEGWCDKNTEYRCLPGICGSSRQHRIVERFCSGTSAECDGDISDPAWTDMPDCDTAEVCEMDQDNVATCSACGAFEICETGTCSCEFEACAGVCCSEEHVCRWTDTCGIGEVKLTASDAAENDAFGGSVSVSGDVAIIGASADDNDNGYGAGAAYIFERNESGHWLQKSKLMLSEGTTDDSFGSSVSVNGDVAIIGAYRDVDGWHLPASAYIYERNVSGDWIEKQKFTAEDGAEYAHFGWSVSLSGGVAIVGAYSDKDNGIISGSAYIFERNETGSWIQKSKLLPSDGADFDGFGSSVSVSGDVAIIGAPQNDDNGDGSGSAYIFERNETANWIQKSKLLPSDGAAGDMFGSSVSLSENLAIVGAMGDDNTGDGSGSAYIFERNDSGHWLQKPKLLPSDGVAGGVRGFGSSVSISGDVAIIGAYWDDDNGELSGSAYIFKRNAEGHWVQKSKLLPSDGAAGDWFGSSVSQGGDVAIIGAFGNDDNGSQSGSAYIF